MYIKRFIKKISLVAMPAISFLSVSTACTKSDIVGLRENERVYKENKEKHDSIFETILQLPNSNPKDINSYKTFTQLF